MAQETERDVDDDAADSVDIATEHRDGRLEATVAAFIGSTARRMIDVFPLAEDGVTVSTDYLAFDFGRYAQEPAPSWPADVIAERLTEPAGLGAYLAELAPGPLLGRVLAAIDPTELDDYSLVELVAANRRMESWYAARTARAAAELSQREALNPTWPASMTLTGAWKCLGAEELAMRLGISRLTARRLVITGRALSGTLRFTAEALESGEIDFAKAQAIVAALVELPQDVALAAQFEVLAKAPERTLHQLREDLTRAVIAVDPEAADTRHRRARQQRRVNRPQALPDGMAHVSAVLPAADAIALDTALDAAARAAKHHGDARTLDQLRADALALMGHTALAVGHLGPHPATHCSCGCTATGGEDDAPPTPAPAPPSHGPRGQDRPPPAHAPPLPGHRLPPGPLPSVRLGMLGGGRADVRITVPLSVLLPEPPDPEETALDREPADVAELEGYGPVPPVVARALAEGGTWRRLVTDPTGTETLDVGRTRYQPPAALAHHVRERDRTCVRPGCSTPARSCDLDHRHEWHRGGRTSVTNLQALCRRDHALKSIGAFTVARASDGTYAWTTATGHGYLRHHDGRTTMLPHGAAAALSIVAENDRPDPATIDHVIARAIALPVTPRPTTADPLATPASHYLPEDDTPLPF